MRNIFYKENKHTMFGQFWDCFIGSFLYALGFNLFIVPHKLFSSGFLGITQLLYHFIKIIFHTPDISINVISLIYFIMNIPLFYLLYKTMRVSFLTKTIFTVLTQSIAIALIPVPNYLIVTDRLTAVIAGAFITGVGCGLILRAASTTGGMDIVGVYFSKKSTRLSVGKITLAVNLTVYCISGLLFGPETMIYSTIYSAINTFIMDRIHLQNICTTATVITQKEGLNEHIIKETKHGSTVWNAYGGYTKNNSQVILTVISKYQKRLMTRMIKEYDPNAFIIYNDNTNVNGNFEKRFDGD